MEDKKHIEKIRNRLGRFIDVDRYTDIQVLQLYEKEMYNRHSFLNSAAKSGDTHE